MWLPHQGVQIVWTDAVAIGTVLDNLAAVLRDQFRARELDLVVLEEELDAARDRFGLVAEEDFAAERQPLVFGAKSDERPAAKARRALDSIQCSAGATTVTSCVSLLVIVANAQIVAPGVTERISSRMRGGGAPFVMLVKSLRKKKFGLTSGGCR
jgi:hypothetical protein